VTAKLKQHICIALAETQRRQERSCRRLIFGKLLV
jgi:hypothetical protein